MADLSIDHIFARGLECHQAGRLEEAEQFYRQILAQQPTYFDALHMLGVLASQAGRHDAAVILLRQAIALHPNSPEAHNNLGKILHDNGRLDEAIAAYQIAITLNPGYANAHSNLAKALQDKGQLDQAIDAYRKAIALDPNSVASANLGKLGDALLRTGRMDEAIAAYRQAIALQPNFVEACNNLGIALMYNGQPDQAIAAYRRAIHLKPDFPEAHGNLLMALNYCAVDPSTITAELRIWNQRYAEPLARLIPSHTNDRSPGRRLRIGYVSPDFRDHPVGRFMAPLLEHHDKNHFEFFAYAQAASPDPMTAMLRNRFDTWRSITGNSDTQVADLVRDDRIDILVDLALHTAHNRLLVFARKPAPVQVTWLGYPGTTGMSAIDYRLTDPHLDPPGLDESIYSEQTIRLPHSFWCYDPLECRDIPVNSLPAASNGLVTFGCLNNFSKINDGVLRLWAGVLRAVPDSRLLLMAPEGSIRQRTLQLFEKEKIAGQRIEFAPRQHRRQYMELYHRIDLGLDTFPYNGHTTSLDSFWMGVPVITIAGATVVGRAGVCQLTNLNLPDLIAQTPEQFVQIAAKSATDLPKLGKLRSSLRQRMEKSPLMDAKTFARDIEAVYRTIWRTWCGAV